MSPRDVSLSAVYGYPTPMSEQDHVVVVVNEFAQQLRPHHYHGM
jgi:hypothetical protein